MAGVRLPRHDRLVTALAAAEQAIVRGHDESAAGLGGLVTALTLGLEDRANLLVKADFVRSGILSGGHGNETETRPQESDDTQADHENTFEKTIGGLGDSQGDADGSRQEKSPRVVTLGLRTSHVTTRRISGQASYPGDAGRTPQST